MYDYYFESKKAMDCKYCTVLLRSEGFQTVMVVMVNSAERRLQGPGQCGIRALCASSQVG
jgi:hypothetical protein